MPRTTVGSVLVNSALPPDLRDYHRILDKGNTRELARQLAELHPRTYADVMRRLHELGWYMAYRQNATLRLSDLKTPVIKRKLMSKLDEELRAVRTDAERVAVLEKFVPILQDTIYEDALKRDNSLAHQVKAGSRGNPAQLSTLLGSDLISYDHKMRPIPLPIRNSYAEGLTPQEYWAGSYDTRRGEIATKFATPKAGFFGKQLAMAAHRLVVTSDKISTKDSDVGLLLEPTEDMLGYVLARHAGNMPAGTVVTPDVLARLRKRGKKVLVHSVICDRQPRGISAAAAGVRERGRLPSVGENIGVTAAQAYAERLSQSQLNVKNQGGDAAYTGFDFINRLAQVPKVFPGAASVAESDGSVTRIEPAKQGGTYVYINGDQHYVPAEREVTVKVGSKVEAGDVLSDGIPSPAVVAKYKGVGAGRLNFARRFHEAFQRAGMHVHPRNSELVARALVNHVRMREPIGNWLPDDIVEYDALAAAWKPRDGAETVQASRVRPGGYLEMPVLHYSIGTRITPTVAKEIRESGVDLVHKHTEPPPFDVEMVRLMDNPAKTDDWMARMGAFNLRRSTTEAVQRGRTADIHGTSFVPGLAIGTEFGKGRPY